MLVLVVLAAVIGCFVFLRRKESAHPAPVRHFEVRQEDGLWAFTVRPTGFAVPTILMAMLPGALIAIVVTAFWMALGHDLDHSGVPFFAAWLAGTALRLGPARRRAEAKARGVTFSVGHGGVVLPSGATVAITGQYVLNRRNAAAYGQPAAYAHYVSLDVDGVTYILAENMADVPSMALYHEVGRRLRGDP